MTTKLKLVYEKNKKKKRKPEGNGNTENASNHSWEKSLRERNMGGLGISLDLTGTFLNGTNRKVPSNFVTKTPAWTESNTFRASCLATDVERWHHNLFISVK